MAVFWTARTECSHSHHYLSIDFMVFLWVERNVRSTGRFTWCIGTSFGESTTWSLFFTWEDCFEIRTSIQYFYNPPSSYTTYYGWFDVLSQWHLIRSTLMNASKMYWRAVGASLGTTQDITSYGAYLILEAELRAILDRIFLARRLELSAI